MSRNVVIAGVVILVLIVGGWFLTRPKQIAAPEVSQPTQESSSSESASAASSGAQMMEKNVVSITAGGFSPQTITIKVGESVTWTNNDSENHTVNSDPHPTHTLNPFLNLGLIKTAEQKSVTISKTGTFTYHDHLNPSLTGSITVE